MVYNGIDLSDEFNDLSDLQNRYFIVNSVSGRDSYSPELTILTANLVDGGYTSHRRLRPRVIDIILTLKGKSYDDMHKRVERLIEILNTDGEDVPITFDDESKRTYYGQVTEMNELEARSKILKLSLTITCTDPFKYGDERLFEVKDDGNVVNYGTTKANPVFDLEVKEKTTFAMVAKGIDDYMLIGQPADDEIVIVEDKVSIMREDGRTLDSWNPATLNDVDSYFIDRLSGTMTSDSTGIRVNGYGAAGEKQHGAGIIRELPSAIQDFELETTFDVNSERLEENWRMGVFMYDENMQKLGHIGLKDNSRFYKRRTPLARVGDYRGSGVRNGNVLGDKDANDKARDLTLFYLRVRRIGHIYSFYVGEWYNRGASHGEKHIRKYQADFKDVNNLYGGRLKYISVYITKRAGRPTPSRIRINSVEVFEHVKTQEDQTPYILYPGDRVTFDHDNREIYVNGEERSDLINFGANFFDLHKGTNAITVTPEGTFDTSVSYVEKYL